MNGDGKHDLVRVTTSDEAILRVALRSGASFATETISWRSNDPNVSFYPWAGGPLPPVASRYRSALRSADFNGDGREDFIAWMNVYDPESQWSQIFVARFIDGVSHGPLDT